MIAGLLIGLGMILPGVSGGVIAVILGVYDKIIFSINNLKKDNVIFLIKTIIGIILGIMISAKILTYFFSKYYVEMSYLFIGLILGTIPLLIKNCNEKCSNKLNYSLIVIITIISAFFSYIIKENIEINSDNLVLYFLSGFLFSIGKIVPGISSSVLLNLIGKYDVYLKIFSNPIDYISNNILQFILIIIGFIVGTIISLKLISYFLNKFYITTYSIIIGFVIGSVIIMYPKVITFPGILIMFIGLVFSLGIPLIKK